MHEICARPSGGGLLLLVENDGPVVAPGPARAGAVGLDNIRARLAARLGSEADCNFGPRETGGWRSAVRIPVTHHDC